MDALTNNGDSTILQTEGALTAKGQLSIPESKRLTVRLGTPLLGEAFWRSIFFVIIVFLLRNLLHDINGQADYVNDQPQKTEDECRGRISDAGQESMTTNFAISALLSV